MTKETKRVITKEAMEAEASRVKKLGPIATCFTIFKGFVCTAILYVPENFESGGYIFTPITLLASMFLTLYCIKLLLEVHSKIGGSYPEMGERAFGKRGRACVEVVLVAS